MGKEKDEKPKSTKTAAEWKDEGNRLYRDLKFVEALEAYNQALALEPEIAVHYTNRAAVYCSLLQADNALKDADKALQLDPSWTKGYMRRGRAYIILGRKFRAVAAFKEALKLEPENQMLQQGLDEAMAMPEEENPDPDDIPEADDVPEEDRAAVERVMKARTFYEMLDLSEEFDAEEMKTKYRKAALALHPDKNKSRRAPEAMKRINEAHQTLTNPLKKTLYDRYCKSATNDNQSFSSFEAEQMDPMQSLPKWVQVILRCPGGAVFLLCFFCIILIPVVVIIFLFMIIFTCVSIAIGTCCPCLCPAEEPEGGATGEGEEGKEGGSTSDNNKEKRESRLEPDIEMGMNDDVKYDLD